MARAAGKAGRKAKRTSTPQRQRGYAGHPPQPSLRADQAAEPHRAEGGAQRGRSQDQARRQVTAAE